jgi:ribosomal protein L7Ae-like RNA K-turn-binding protein
MVIVSEEASDNTIKKFSNMTDFYDVPFVRFGTKEELGHCIGKEFRASIAICEENLANAIEQKLTEYRSKTE